jgi:hypothetical protein
VYEFIEAEGDNGGASTYEAKEAVKPPTEPELLPCYSCGAKLPEPRLVLRGISRTGKSAPHCSYCATRRDHAARHLEDLDRPLDKRIAEAEDKLGYGRGVAWASPSWEEE